MKNISILFIMCLSLSSYAEQCSEDQINEAIHIHETETNPYSDGEYEYTVEELKLNSEKGPTAFYDAVLGYEYSEGGYRILEIEAKSTKSKCETVITVVDES